MVAVVLLADWPVRAVLDRWQVRLQLEQPASFRVLLLLAALRVCAPVCALAHSRPHAGGVLLVWSSPSRRPVRASLCVGCIVSMIAIAAQQPRHRTRAVCVGRAPSTVRRRGHGRGSSVEVGRARFFKEIGVLTVKKAQNYLASRGGTFLSDREIERPCYVGYTPWSCFHA